MSPVKIEYLIIRGHGQPEVSSLIGDDKTPLKFETPAGMVTARTYSKKVPVEGIGNKVRQFFGKERVTHEIVFMETNFPIKGSTEAETVPQTKSEPIENSNRLTRKQLYPLNQFSDVTVTASYVPPESEGK